MDSRLYPLRRRNQENFDRFIPCRSAMDFGYAITMVTMKNNERNRKENSSEYSVLYRQKLAEAADLPSRILAFRNKPLKPRQSPPSPQAKPSKPQRHIPQTSERKLDVPDILDDFCLNLLDWGCSNVLSIALENDVYLWNASNKSTAKLVTVDEEDGPVTSVSWGPDGSRLAIGLDSSLVQVWDTIANKQLTTFKSGHRAGVSSLAWNNSHILTTGGMNGKIVNNDLRVRSHIDSYRGHTDEVCGLKWSLDGKKLASGGSDNVVHIWDRSAVSPNSRTTRWLHKFEEHTAAVKALAWCPFQSDLLASGGGEGDQCIKLWNMRTGALLDSVDTGSEVCALLWNKNERELLSSHGLTTNQLTLWKYPSMAKMVELNGHTSRVLYMTQSPDGCTVATAAADETLRFWNVFGTPKATPKTNHEPFANFNRIR